MAAGDGGHGKRGDGVTTFELKPEHVALLRRAYVGWQNCETGAPEIDPKRPYGNSSVPPDVWEIVNGRELERELTMPEEKAMYDLHRQTETALQVVLATGSFEPGVYEGPRWGSGPGWRRIGGPTSPAASVPTEPAPTAESDDWTAGPGGGSNNSHLSKTLTDEVERIIRNGAHDLIAGRAGTVAGVILARLAHEHGLRPRGERRRAPEPGTAELGTWKPEVATAVDALRALDWAGFDPASLDDLADIAAVVVGALHPPAVDFADVLPPSGD